MKQLLKSKNRRVFTCCKSSRVNNVKTVQNNPELCILYIILPNHIACFLCVEFQWTGYNAKSLFYLIGNQFETFWMYSTCAGLLTALTSSQSSHCSCCNLTFMRCHFSVDYQLDRCPALQCTHCHPFHRCLCKQGNFAPLSVLPAAFERRGKGAWDKEEGVLQEERERTTQDMKRRRNRWGGMEWWKEEQ